MRYVKNKTFIKNTREGKWEVVSHINGRLYEVRVCATNKRIYVSREE